MRRCACFRGGASGIVWDVPVGALAQEPVLAPDVGLRACSRAHTRTRVSAERAKFKVRQLTIADGFQHGLLPEALLGESSSQDQQTCTNSGYVEHALVEASCDHRRLAFEHRLAGPLGTFQPVRALQRFMSVAGRERRRGSDRIWPREPLQSGHERWRTSRGSRRLRR